MKKLLAIDGNSVLNRAFYGVKPLTTKDGLFTQAVFGLVNIIQSQLDSVKPDYTAAAFDLKAPTFRHKMYDGYKAQRKGMPQELAVQLPYAKEVLSAMGVLLLEKEGYEADDILGTLAELGDEELHVYILTGDKDSLQLISDHTTVLLVSTGVTTSYDERKFVEKYGIKPSQYVDVKALMGDSSDNIPGVPGIGEKTAFKLIAEKGSLDAVYSDVESLTLGKAAKEKLASGRDSAYMSQTLARICRTVPLGDVTAELSEKRGDDEKLLELFKKLEFSAFIKRYALDAPKSSDEKTVFENDKLPQTKGTLYSLRLAEGFAYLYDGKNGCRASLDTCRASAFFAENDFISEDSKALYGIIGNANVVFDTALAAYVLNSSDNSYTVEKLSLKYLGKTQSKNEETDPDAEAAVDIFKLYGVLRERLEAEGSSKLFYETELPLSRVLFDMESRGFMIDREGLAAYGVELNGRLEVIKERIYAFAGGEFNVNSPKQLSEILFDYLHLPSGKKTKTGYSTNADVLEKLRPHHPIVDEILAYRALAKLIGTYVDGMLKVCGEDGIIHTSFNQTVTATGRLSSTEPNLQNIPVRTDDGRQLRKYFVTRSDKYTLIDADYSQIELRLLAAISGDETMLYAFEHGVDIHTMTASQVFGVPQDAVTPEMRKRAKAVNFGIVYGIGSFSLSQDIGVSVKAAGNYIDNYLRNYPSVSEYLENVKAQAKRDGYVTTLFGRRRYIPELSSAKKAEQAFGERVAMNSPIQGSAADIIKIAMVNTAAALKKSGCDARLILQIHDELIIEADKACEVEIRELLKREMENAVSLPVKLSVEVSSGDNWYNCK